MFIRINSPSSMHGAVRYHENKVNNGVAECIDAGNFLKDAAMLSLKEKLARFDQLTDRNQIVWRNVLHAYISFHPADKPSKELMSQIAGEFVSRVGFGKQPYLVYRHNDNGNPHIHIVSTNIRTDGSRIDMTFLGFKSLPIGRSIWLKYGLRGRSNDKPNSSNPPQKIQYDKASTIAAITDVLKYVLENYRYRDLHDLNTILRLYNLRACEGGPGSRTRKFGGLYYQILDEKGRAVSMPVRASTISFKPGLAYLRNKFLPNAVHPIAPVSRIQLAIRDAMYSCPPSLEILTQALLKEKIKLIPIMDRPGGNTEFNYVDLDEKLVVKDADLASDISTAALCHQLGLDPLLKPLTLRPDMPSMPERSDRPDMPLMPELSDLPALELEENKKGVTPRH